jgi:hypothetical protein
MERDTPATTCEMFDMKSAEDESREALVKLLQLFEDKCRWVKIKIKVHNNYAAWNEFCQWMTNEITAECQKETDTSLNTNTTIPDACSNVTGSKITAFESNKEILTEGPALNPKRIKQLLRVSQEKFVNEVGDPGEALDFEATIISSNLPLQDLPKSYATQIEKARAGRAVNGYYWGFLLNEYRKLGKENTNDNK